MDAVGDVEEGRVSTRPPSSRRGEPDDAFRAFEPARVSTRPPSSRRGERIKRIHYLRKKGFQPAPRRHDGGNTIVPSARARLTCFNPPPVVTTGGTGGGYPASQGCGVSTRPPSSRRGERPCGGLRPGPSTFQPAPRRHDGGNRGRSLRLRKFRGFQPAPRRHDGGNTSDRERVKQRPSFQPAPRRHDGGNRLAAVDEELGEVSTRPPSSRRGEPEVGDGARAGRSVSTRPPSSRRGEPIHIGFTSRGRHVSTRPPSSRRGEPCRLGACTYCIKFQPAPRRHDGGNAPARSARSSPASFQPAPRRHDGGNGPALVGERIGRGFNPPPVVTTGGTLVCRLTGYACVVSTRPPSSRRGEPNVQYAPK